MSGCAVPLLWVKLKLYHVSYFVSRSLSPFPQEHEDGGAYAKRDRNMIYFLTLSSVATVVSCVAGLVSPAIV
eukprot:7078396-Pyramimonas_sp.AAC.1